jgi:hypothetical protein
LRDAKFVYVNAKVQVNAQLVYIGLKDGDEIFVKLVVHRLHISVLDGHAENVFVEGAREIAVQKFVIKYGLGYYVTNEFKVTQMIRIEVRRRIWHVSDTIARVYHEQGIVGIEDFFRNDHVPF